MILQPIKPAGRRRLTYLFIVSTVLALPLLAGCGGGGGGGGGGGTTGGSKVTVQGQLTDPFANPVNSPVDGVTVTLVGTSDSTTSFNNTGNGGVDGWYSLTNVPANSTVSIKYTDSSTGGTVTESVTTGSSTMTENVNYPFSLGGPP